VDLGALGETPWVDRHLRQTWAILQQEIDPDLLPLELPQRAFSVEELGCGYFGCVMPTANPGVVVKLTTDESEAWFAYVAMQLAARDGWPPGVVRYHNVLKLQGRSHRRRPLYLLWRDTAWHVGFLRGQFHDALYRNLQEYDRWTALVLHKMRRKGSDSGELLAEAARYEERVWTDVAEHLRFKGDLIQVGLSASPSRQHGYDVAVAVRACATIAQFMANTYGNDTLGTALEYYIDSGLLICDLHAGNVGMIRIADYDELQPGITDPGLTVPVDLKWLDVRLPESIRLYTP